MLARQAHFESLVLEAWRPSDVRQHPEDTVFYGRPYTVNATDSKHTCFDDNSFLDLPLRLPHREAAIDDNSSDESDHDSTTTDARSDTGDNKGNDNNWAFQVLCRIANTHFLLLQNGRLSSSVAFHLYQKSLSASLRFNR